MYSALVDLIRGIYNSSDFIPLHEPNFNGNEKKYVAEAIDSTFVSSVGKFVQQFEDDFAKFVGSKHAVAVVNGTAALHIGLKVCGVTEGDEVITQPLTFVATCNAISYCGAKPVFIDVDRDTMGLSPSSLAAWLERNAIVKNNQCFNRVTGKVIRACVPMHTFGHPARIIKIKEICEHYNIALVEDAAESLGSYTEGKHTGRFGQVGAFSFNGNKVMTTGGGGMLITDDSAIAKRAKHLTTTAKVAHQWNYEHDEVGYNYRLPNLNAALGCAQLERLSDILIAKRELADIYQDFFSSRSELFVSEMAGNKSNYWLNAVIVECPGMRDELLHFTNSRKVMTRPIWQLMNRLEMFKSCQSSKLDNAQWLESRVVNIPSSVVK